MKLMVLLAFLITLSGTLWLGARLVRAGMRTRGTPELVYGSALLLSGVGSMVRVIVFGIVGVSDETRMAVVLASLFSVATLIVTTTGLRMIFYPLVRWPYAVQVVLVAIALAGTWSIATGHMNDGPRPFSQTLNDVANSSMMAWGAVASFVYWGKLKRRRKLGIADPVVTEQFRLWGTSFTVGTCASISLWLTPLWTGQKMLDIPAVAVGVNLALVAMTLLLWMAFYPPAWYRQRVMATATAG